MAVWSWGQGCWVCQKAWKDRGHGQDQPTSLPLQSIGNIVMKCLVYLYYYAVWCHRLWWAGENVSMDRQPPRAGQGWHLSSKCWSPWCFSFARRYYWKRAFCSRYCTLLSTASPETFLKCLNVNVVGVQHCFKLATNLMIKASHELLLKVTWMWCYE